MRDQRNWTWHVISGVVILVFAGLHMAIMHLDSLLGIFNPAGGHPIEWANVLRTAINWLLIIVGVGLFAVGTWAAWASFMLA
jgi:hypothetical protein